MGNTFPCSFWTPPSVPRVPRPAPCISQATGTLQAGPRRMGAAPAGLPAGRWSSTWGLAAAHACVSELLQGSQSSGPGSLSQQAPSLRRFPPVSPPQPVLLVAPTPWPGPRTDPDFVSVCGHGQKQKPDGETKAVAQTCRSRGWPAWADGPRRPCLSPGPQAAQTHLLCLPLLQLRWGYLDIFKI